MFDKIMKPGEKLKALRNMHHVTQEELAGISCTKNNISQIENNKQKLNFNLAVELIGNLHRIANKKKIEVYLITPEELIKSEDNQANDVFEKNIIKKLKEINSIPPFEEKLNEAEKLMGKYCITDNNKIKLYKLASKFYYYKSLYNKNDEMCDRGLKASINSQNSLEEAHFYIKRSRNYIMLEEYSRALEQLGHAEKINNNINNDELSVNIFYYNALTYKKLCEYDTALKYFKIVDQFEIKDKEMLLKIKMVYANCLNDYHKFDEAEKEYNELLKIAIQYEDKDIISLTYKNLAELYFNDKDYKFAAVYIKQAVECNPKNIYLNETLYFAATVLKNLDEDIEMYLLDALDICEKDDRENLNLVEKILYELVLLYTEREDEENISIMANKVEELNINHDLIYSQFAKYYRCRNGERCEYFLDKSIEKSKKSKKIL